MKYLSFCEKCELVRLAPAQMESSKMLCLDDAVRLKQTGHAIEAYARLEKAAKYAWGLSRPSGWTVEETAHA